MKKDHWASVILLVVVPFMLWFFSIYIFSTQYIDQSITNLGHIANWGSFTLRNEAKYRKKNTTGDAGFIPTSTQRALNAYALKFPISFYFLFNDQVAARVRSPLSEMKKLPPSIKWDGVKLMDGDSIAYLKTKTPEGTTLILAKNTLTNTENSKVELIMTQELTDYDDFFWTFVLISFLFFVFFFSIIGFIFKRVSGDLIREIGKFNEFVNNVSNQGKEKIQTLTTSRFVPIRNLSQTFFNYLETTENLTNRLNLTSQTLLEESDSVSTVIENQSISFMEYRLTITQVTAASSQISASSEAITNLTKRIEAIALENKTKIDIAIEEIESMARKMDKIEGQANEFKSLLEKNSEQISEISNISTIIQKINEELKLISFNAQIEAVSGKNQAQRFKVVANEVRELANTVGKSVADIKQQTEKIIENTHSAQTMYSEVNKLVSEGSTQLHQITRSIDLLSDSATENLSSSRQISYSAAEQLAAINEIVRSMNSMNDQTSELNKQVELLGERANQLKNSGHILNNMLVELKGLN